MKTVAALAAPEGCDCMTIEEVKKTYGCSVRGYYISCMGCPVRDHCHLHGASGYEDCWNEIACYMNINNHDIPESEPDNVNHPAHYETGKFECIDVMVETQGKEAVKAYCLCAAFKYLYRHNRKNGLEDIKKARWYLDKYVELEGENNG
jgi:hypothetical protein